MPSLRGMTILFGSWPPFQWVVCVDFYMRKFALARLFVWLDVLSVSPLHIRSGPSLHCMCICSFPHIGVPRRLPISLWGGLRLSPVPCWTSLLERLLRWLRACWLTLPSLPDLVPTRRGPCLTPLGIGLFASRQLRLLRLEFGMRALFRLYYVLVCLFGMWLSSDSVLFYGKFAIVSPLR